MLEGLAGLTDEMEDASDFDWSKAEKDTLNTTAMWPSVWGTVISTFYAVNVRQRADKANKEHANALWGALRAREVTGNE